MSCKRTLNKKNPPSDPRDLALGPYKMYFSGQDVRMADAKSLHLHLSVIKCDCPTYDDNIGPKLKQPSFVILGE